MTREQVIRKQIAEIEGKMRDLCDATPIDPTEEDIFWRDANLENMAEELLGLEEDLWKLTPPRWEDGPDGVPASHDKAWQREIAREEGMLQGIDAYNDHMGY